MLDLPRYLLGVFEIALLAGFATLGASAVRSRLLPDFTGAPAHLATGVIALALLIWAAEILGSFGLFGPVAYLIGVGVVGLGLRLGVEGGRGYPSGLLGFSPGGKSCSLSGQGEKQDAAAPEGYPRPPSQGPSVATVIALVVAAVAVVKFGLDVRPKLSSGMTGFDSTWYHGPFAAGFAQSGDTWSLHFIAPQFLAWFYPANAEIFHGVGMLAFDRDLLSPLLNLGWFAGCLVACWCMGKPYGVAPWSLALGAVALGLPLLSDQAGEARNDIVGIFFLLAAVAVALNGWGARKNGQAGGEGSGGSGDLGAELGPLVVVGLAAGLAAGTKLNFLLPAAVLVLGLALIVPTGKRWRALAAAGLAAFAGGGYWYLRNLAHSGNPLPWFDSIGPISLPAPDQALGGREGHSVLSYLTDGTVWSDWFLPGFHDGLTLIWPLFAAGALAGLLLCLVGRGAWLRFEPDSEPNLNHDRVLPLVGLVGIAVIVAWLVAPTSASGPEGLPRGFESGLRYLAPALALGLAVLPAAILPWVARWRGSPIAEGSRSESEHMGEGRRDRTRGPLAAVVLAMLVVVAIGYPVQRHYLENRYANPSFAAPGLNAAFKWADPLSGARIATTSTRQYPLYGTDLSNHVQYIGEEQFHGGFTAPTSCKQWRHTLNAGHYEYVVTSRDRIEEGKPPYPASTRWTEGLGVEEVLRQPPAVVFRLKGPLDPAACRQ
ncbi:MAG: hypothetical protein ABW196_08425 [Solirubrobacterales bacterium]